VKNLVIMLCAAFIISGCSKPQEHAEEQKEQITYAVTRWSPKTELFMEHPPLVAGKKHRFAIHFTDIRGAFKAVTAGTATVELRSPSGKTEKFTSAEPSRPGIFGADITPSTAGEYAMTVTLDAPGLQDRQEAGSVKVYASEKDAELAPAPEEAEAISFLKEQQWNLDFATEEIVERQVRDSITAPGEVMPRSGGESFVSAPVAGRISNIAGVTPGMSVERGQTLASIVPLLASVPNRSELESTVTQARGELELATKERERVGRLVDARAVPTRRLEEAQAGLNSAQARLQSAQTNLAQLDSLRSRGEAPQSAMFSIRAPISGTIAQMSATPGATVEAGQQLFRIVSTETVTVVSHVPESEAERIRKLGGAEIDRNGETPIPLTRMVGSSRVIDPQTRTLSVVYELQNQQARLAVGQSVQVRLFTGEERRGAAVPESSIVDDAGQPVVFVQLAGESFARRPVKVTAKQNGYAHIDGVKPGERVVSKGGYLIRLSALSGQIPAHGHVH
jgi:membrane fusion protein, heavy metal efflux system